MVECEEKDTPVNTCIPTLCVVSITLIPVVHDNVNPLCTQVPGGRV